MQNPLSGRRFTDTEKTEILRLYESGVLSGEISRRFQCGTQSILDLVRRLGGEVRRPGGDHARALTDDQELHLIEMYKQGVPMGEITRIFNVGQSCIGKIRRKRGVPNRPRTKGAANPRWKGGTRKPADGYIEERILSDDPLFCMVRAGASGGGGYAFQHRIVMARHLGRPLESHETVHHKNGIRSDNRIENLELWSSKHPKGARVVDQVAWAKEILAKYEPELPMLMAA